MRALPNQLTAIRLLLIPILWIFALRNMQLALGVGLLVALLTDIFDGIIARRMNQTSDFGSAFDSLADNLLAPSAMIWLLLLKREVFTENRVLCLVAISIYTLTDRRMAEVSAIRKSPSLYIENRRGCLVPVYHPRPDRRRI
jgi:phosphatidylglycerophosphate synthase